MGAIFRALAATGLAVLAFVTLRNMGVSADSSLIVGLVLAGVLNIQGLAALNGDGGAPTCGAAVGEH